jgi:hypothetical protein
MTPRGYGSILLLAILLTLAASPVAALAADPSVPVPLAAVGVPNLLQEKGKLQYTWEDFKADGEKALQNENYPDAIANFNKAEELLVANDPGRSAGTDFALSQVESKKAFTYASWGGHDAEETEANRKADTLKASAQQKARAEGTGCLIVTATFGSPLAGEVQLVRSFRDESIKKSYTGSRFMPGFNAWYYSFSPQVSMYISEHPVVKPVMQVLITPILQIVLFAQVCYSFLSFNPELATVVAIIVGSILYSLVYVFPAVMAGVWVARRRGWDGGNIRILRPAAVAWGTILLLIMAGVVFSLDLLTTVASGLFVIATIIITSGALSLTLSRYVGRKGVPAQQ